MMSRIDATVLVTSLLGASALVASLPAADHLQCHAQRPAGALTASSRLCSLRSRPPALGAGATSRNYVASLLRCRKPTSTPFSSSHSDNHRHWKLCPSVTRVTRLNSGLSS